MAHDIEKIRKASDWEIKYTVEDYAEDVRHFCKTKGELYTYTLMLEQMKSVKDDLSPVLGALNTPRACNGLDLVVNSAKRDLKCAAELLIEKAQRMEEIGFEVDEKLIAEAVEILGEA